MLPYIFAYSKKRRHDDHSLLAYFYPEAECVVLRYQVEEEET